MEYKSRVRNIAAALSFALLGAAVHPAAAQKEPIKLGLLAELTGGGAASGAATNWGVRLAVKEINDRGGILGRPIELVVADNQTDPTISVNEALRLIDQQHVDAMIGLSLTQLALAVIPVTNKEKVPLITTAASTQITPQVGPYHFSMSATAVDWATVMVDYAVDTAKARSAAVLGDNGGFSKDAAAALKRRMAERNLPLSGEAEYAFRTTDMTPQMLNLRRGNPDLVLFSVTSPEDFARILTTLGDINWSVPLVGAISVSVMAAAVVKQVGPAAFGRTTGLGYSGLTYCSNQPVGESEFAKFETRLKAFAPDVYDRIPKGVTLFWYDGVYVLKAAIEGAGTTQGDKVAAWLENNGSSVHAIVGPLQPSKTSHFLLGPKSLTVVERPYELRADGMQKRAGC
jgi:ABC-type branched-subunit amino acid transport system substrate-binding protein